MTARSDLTGIRYGSLTAIKFERTASNRSGWRVLCDCGNTHVVEASNLTSKIRIGCNVCGHVATSNSRRHDLSGMKFGRLTVISWEKFEGPSKGTRWICRCDCGESHRTTPANLKNGKASQCRSCALIARGKKRRRYVDGGLTQTLWNSICHGATSRGIMMSISATQAYQKFTDQHGLCALSGIPIAFRDRSIRQHTASLDRIDSKSGYDIGNIQWVHVDINRMKNSFPQDVFVNWCIAIANFASKNIADSEAGKSRGNSSP